MITQDARGRCQGIWSSQLPARGPKGCYLSPKGGRRGPRTKHMLKHTCHPSTPSPTAEEGNKYTQTLSTIKCTGEDPTGEFPPPITDRGQSNVIYIQCSQYLMQGWENLGGEGVAVSAHLAQGSFMLNRWGATLIPTSSKTEQARRDLQTPSWHQARGKTVLCRVP